MIVNSSRTAVADVFRALPIKDPSPRAQRKPTSGLRIPQWTGMSGKARGYNGLRHEDPLVHEERVVGGGVGVGV